MKLQCPHCSKDVFIRVEKEDSLNKEVAKATVGLRAELGASRNEVKELKKQLEAGN